MISFKLKYEKYEKLLNKIARKIDILGSLLTKTAARLQVTLLEVERGSTFWLNPVNMAKMYHQYAVAIINYTWITNFHSAFIPRPKRWEIQGIIFLLLALSFWRFQIKFFKFQSNRLNNLMLINHLLWNCDFYPVMFVHRVKIFLCVNKKSLTQFK